MQVIWGVILQATTLTNAKIARQACINGFFTRIHICALVNLLSGGIGVSIHTFAG